MRRGGRVSRLRCLMEFWYAFLFFSPVIPGLTALQDFHDNDTNSAYILMYNGGLRLTTWGADATATKLAISRAFYKNIALFFFASGSTSVAFSIVLRQNVSYIE